MPTRCTVCAHDQRREIDRALLRGTPYRDVEGRFKVSRSALSRHQKAHVPVSLAQSEASRSVRDEEAHARDVGDELARLQAETDRILEEAKEYGQLRTALAAIREARYLLDLRIRVAEVEDLEARIAELERRAS